MVIIFSHWSLKFAPGRMAVCLGVVPDVYFIDYNTKRDYQTERKSGIQTGP